MSFHYRRVIGGIGWPRNGRPGAVVVVGEDHIEDKNAGRRPLYVLDEAERHDIMDLYEICVTLQQEHGDVKWFADCAHSFGSIFEKQNRKNNLRRRRGVRLNGVPEAYGELDMVTSIILQRVQNETKSLYFGNVTIFPARLVEIGLEDAQARALEDFPAMAALGLAVSNLDLSEPRVAREVLNVDAMGWT